MKRAVSIMLIVALCICTFSFSGSAVQKQLKGVWVCTVGNIDFPSERGLDSRKLQSELDDIVLNCKSAGLNAIFFQVRPNSDALYKSSVFPWSEVLTGEQGKAPENDFDPLEYIISAAHKSGLQLHAWINPYRVGTGQICEKNPAKQHPEYTVICSDGSVYYNPALPEVRELIISGVKEIVRDYDVDGIHFDDYFYPYDEPDYPDAEEYQKYGKDFSNIADFRRNNVNQLIKDTYAAVHSVNTAAVFGVSPFGIWDNKRTNPDGSDTHGMSSYNSIFADSRAWVLNGWVDYICPQVYWSFENKSAPFDNVTKWWSELCSGTNTKLYIGIAAYKLGTDEQGFETSSQIERQLSYCKSLGNVSGTVIFRYKNIADNTCGITDLLKDAPLTLIKKSATLKGEDVTQYNPGQNSRYVKPKSLTITSPGDGCTVTDANVSVTGICDVSYPLTVDGKAVPATSNGYFSVYLPLSAGKNIFRFKNGEKTETISIVRKSVPSLNPLTDTCFEKESAYPIGSCVFSGGEVIKFEIHALKGANVFVRNGNKRTQLCAGETVGGFSTYSANIVMPDTLAGEIDMGEYSFIAEYNGKEYAYSECAEIKLVSSPDKMYTESESYIYDSYSEGSMMDNFQIPANSPVLITGRVGGRSRMQNGKWIETEKLSVNKSSDSIDIDMSKYSKLDIKFEKDSCINTFVSGSGMLVIEFLGASLNKFTLKSDVKLDTDITTCAGYTFITVKHADFYISGYRMAFDDKKLTVWVYNKIDSSLSGKTIAIDPGHGGSDFGALGPAGEYGYAEKDLNLEMSYTLKQKLESAGARVVLTREDDTTLPLAGRAELMRSYNPDLCISVHHNSVSQGEDYGAVSGIGVYFSRQTSKPLAVAVESGIGQKFKSYGVKKKSLNVCRDSRYPCILIECGFICNPEEYEKLITDEYKNTLCDNITQSICEYFGSNR